MHPCRILIACAGILALAGTAPGDTLDTVSHSCLACHDGGTSAPLAAEGTGDHPVGMRYGDYADRLPGEYRPVAALGTGIVLVEGRVSCISCHESRVHVGGQLLLASLADGDTAIDGCLATERINSGTDGSLCLSCHIR